MESTTPFEPSAQRNQMCPCGSGLRYKHCCGKADPAANRIDPAEAVAAGLKEIEVKAAAGERDEALALCRGLVERFPRAFPPKLRLAEMLTRRNDTDAAIAAYQEVIRTNPNRHESHADLAGIYLRLKRYPDAERHARRALALNPLNPQAHNLMGSILSETFNFEDAEFHFRQVMLIHEPVAPICANFGGVLTRLGKLDEAADQFRMSAHLEPRNIENWLRWARMEEARREIDRAGELVGEAEKIAPDLPAVHVARATVLRRQKRHDEALAALDAVAEKVEANLLSSAYYFARGDVLDKLKRYDEAFAAYTNANTRARRERKLEYQRDHLRRLTDSSRAFFIADRIKPIRANDAARTLPEGFPKPLFIIGFPRSGTTLTEQMLSSHHAISPGGELDYFWRMTRLASHLSGSKQPYPQCLEHLAEKGWEGRLEKFRTYYLGNLMGRRLLEPGKTHVIDKMPLNETNLGLIHLVFPEAPLLHLVRHPLDVVLSTFFNDLTHGGNCSFDLETAAEHYMLIFGMIEHYRKELDLKYLRIRYETLVDEPETTLRKVLEFSGLPWDDACLAHDANKRYARTASYAQVAEKLYKESSYRYRNYRTQVERIVPLLAPAIRKLGYEVED